jgi:hypothetical protein
VKKSISAKKQASHLRERELAVGRGARRVAAGVQHRPERLAPVVPHGVDLINIEW